MSVGAPLPHDAARLHVTGAARYVDDIPVPANTLHLAFGLSEHARARISGIDLDHARAVNGCHLVWSAEDLPHPIDCSPSAHDEPLLAEGEVRYAGQPVVLVAATSHLAARKAARRAQINYDVGDPVLSIDDALAANSCFEDPRVYARGDVEAALAKAPHRIDGKIEIGGQEHFYLEGQAALALPQDDGSILVHASTQHPTEIQHKVADALGRPMSDIRVEVRRMGGGFGGKESQGNALAIACAVVADQTGRPAKMRYDRDDDFRITGKRHDFRIGYNVGFDAAGRIEGIAFTHYVRCGWSQDLSLPVADRAMLHADNAYFLPNVRIESYRLKTNSQSATAFRGFGGPQGMLGIERVMDEIAHTLGLDPTDVRQANYYGRHGRVTPYGMEVKDFVLSEMTGHLLDSSAYASRKLLIKHWNSKHPTLKRGLAFSPVKFGISFTLTHLNQAGALVHVYQDGSIQLNHGGTEMGQGLFQKVAQVAATSFGVPLNSVKITATDTGKVPNTSATAASSGSDLNGMAVLAACDTIRARMTECLGKSHKVDPSEIRFSNGIVHVGGTQMTFAEVARFSHANRVSLSATGYYATPDLLWDRMKGDGRPFFYFAYGCAITEVVIDTLTGENRILRADILHDCGASLNPAIDLGQIEGGFVQGAGWLTSEELVWDEAGKLRTHAPSTYKIPACGDRPRDFKVDLWDAENPEATIYRSKAVGEPPLMLGISAWLALSDAVQACGSGWPDLQAPATPEAILAAIGRATA
jgi:xanthine dehydrogenase large subunit